MTEAYKIANAKCALNRAKGKKMYDRRVCSSGLLPGDRVLVRNLSKRENPAKLRSYPEDKIHVLVTRRGVDSPVYKVKPESSDGPKRTLHRNMLLPCNSLPLQPLPPQEPAPRQRKRTVLQNRECTGQMESDSEDDLDGLTVVPVEQDTPLPSDQDSEPNRADIAIPVPAEDPNTSPAADGDDITTVSVQNPTDDIQQPVVPAGSELPAPVENTRPTRTRNPPARLNYWTPGN